MERSGLEGGEQHSKGVLYCRAPIVCQPPNVRCHPPVAEPMSLGELLGMGRAGQPPLTSHIIPFEFTFIIISHSNLDTILLPFSHLPPLYTQFPTIGVC